MEAPRPEDAFLEAIVPQCDSCAHMAEPFECPAFPDGIPDDIVMNDAQHTAVRADQAGTYVYTPIKNI